MLFIILTIPAGPLLSNPKPHNSILSTANTHSGRSHTHLLFLFVVLGRNFK